MGRKMVLYSAFVLFAVGSIVFAVSPNMGILIFGRAIQGLGGGGLDVLSEVITADITTLKERAFWIGMLSVPMAAGCILGPILGAVFSDYANWSGNPSLLHGVQRHLHPLTIIMGVQAMDWVDKPTSGCYCNGLGCHLHAPEEA